MIQQYCFWIFIQTNQNLSDISTPKAIAALFTIAKMWKEPESAVTDEWLKKMCYLCIYAYTHAFSEIPSSLKKAGNSALCNNMDKT